MERIDAPPGKPLLLHGVTGSGKTEVYLRSVAAALERGRSAIVLVPEIALTPQTAGRFVERFGDAVAIMHSQLSARERYDEWWRMRRGEARVCVGPRSAVFAPFDDLGLIVVDEEHDSSYKQEGDPRYDARVVAERRAELEGALLLAGSATPRPESQVRYERLELRERVDGRGLPPVEVVGMAGVAGPLHERTRQELDGVRRRGEKAIVLLNRRGWSNFLSCRLCGRVWECPDCDVTLVLHQAAGELACHHCGHRGRVPSECPDCGSVSVARHGAGTEQLERELEQVVAPLPVFRLDSDVAASSGIAGVLRAFEAADAGVLVGTQMVAKGHDFPDVTLGVVLDADATLRFPDFRAEERTFALVAQLAGRSGRGERGGRVIVQALEPQARALCHAAGHDASGFLAGRAAPPRGVRLPALRAPDPGRLLLDRVRPRARGRHGRAGADRGRRGAGAGAGPAVSPAGAPPRAARGRAHASARRRSSPFARPPWRPWRPTAGTARRRSRWTWTRSSSAARLVFMAQGSTSQSKSRPSRSRPSSRRKRHRSIPEVEARRVAAMSFIRRLGDPVLKSRATPVDRFDDSLRRQVSRMAGIMHDALGVGLAAPQLGISQRLLVYRVGPDAPVTVLANPELEWASGEVEVGEEGCLSIPGVVVDVDRPVYVRVRGSTRRARSAWSRHPDSRPA